MGRHAPLNIGPFQNHSHNIMCFYLFIFFKASLIYWHFAQASINTALIDTHISLPLSNHFIGRGSRKRSGQAVEATQEAEQSAFNVTGF